MKIFTSVITLYFAVSYGQIKRNKNWQDPDFVPIIEYEYTDYHNWQDIWDTDHLDNLSDEDKKAILDIDHSSEERDNLELHHFDPSIFDDQFRGGNFEYFENEFYFDANFDNE